MKQSYNDINSYLFDKEDKPEACFLCKCSAERLLVVRQISNMMLVHLCGECMLDNMNDYLLDNTRPWIEGGPKK